MNWRLFLQLCDRLCVEIEKKQGLFTTISNPLPKQLLNAFLQQLPQRKPQELQLDANFELHLSICCPFLSRNAVKAKKHRIQEISSEVCKSFGLRRGLVAVVGGIVFWTGRRLGCFGSEFEVVWRMVNAIALKGRTKSTCAARSHGRNQVTLIIL